jgi:hypothetical protein
MLKELTYTMSLEMPWLEPPARTFDKIQTSLHVRFHYVRLLLTYCLLIPTMYIVMPPFLRFMTSILSASPDNAIAMQV